MTNNNEESYKMGKNSDGEVPFFNPNAGMSKDPPHHNEKAINISAPPMDLPITLQPMMPITKLLPVKQVDGLKLIELKDD